MGKKTLKFSEIAHEHPLLRTSELDGVTTTFAQAQNNYLLSQRIPLREVDAEKVVMDVEKVTRGGMTPMVSRNQESPIYNNPHGRSRREFRPAAFREKTILEPHELKELRKLGTREDLISARELLRMRFSSLQTRLANRMEFMRKEMIFDNQVQVATESGQTYTVNYSHAGYLEGTVGNTWDNTGTATPMQDLQTFIDDYEDDTGKMVTEIFMPHDIMDDLIQNDRVLKIANNNFSAFDGSKQAVKRAVADYLDIGSIRVSKDKIHFTADLSADAAQGASTLTFTRVPRLSSGDEIFIHRMSDDHREKHTVSSVSGNTVTINGTIQDSGGFSANDHVRWQEYTVPRDRLLFLGQSRAEMQRSDEGSLVANYEDMPWAEVVSTPSHYADMENPQPGLFTKSLDRTNEDPPRLEQIIGINALPRLNDQDAYATLTIR